ncbi:MAG: hypothetical protein O3A10_14960 [Chloroflexi bacterium]|nr:hypothetical protein [Chloroflexota bacterium]MDA1147996.1 hypothetical protein [Chloroflexota bacterium]
MYELAGASGTTPAPTKVVEPRCLDDEALATIEFSLRGGLSDSECRLRLRSYGRAAGTAARLAGQRPAATIRSFLPVRREISEVVAHVRFSAGIGRSEVDERQWSDSLADAFFLGLADSADVIRARVRGGERRRGETTVKSRRGPPQ